MFWGEFEKLDAEAASLCPRVRRIGARDLSQEWESEPQEITEEDLELIAKRDEDQEAQFWADIETYQRRSRTHHGAGRTRRSGE